LKVIEIEQGTSEWKEWRSGLYDFDYPAVTATTASAIGGRNKYTSARKVFEEYLGIRAPQESNFAMDRGTELEPFARAAACEALGDYFESVCIESSLHPWIRASLDGINAFSTEALEIKCPVSSNMAEALKTGQSLEEVQPGYYDQLMWQFAASDLKLQLIHFCIYDEVANACDIFPITPDHERIEILKRCAIEWRKMVLNGEYTWGMSHQKKYLYFPSQKEVIAT
jgi:putative phage-type endonuclease